jgi:hypothetical protein
MDLLDAQRPETEVLRMFADWSEAGTLPSQALLAERFVGGRHEALVAEAQAAALEQQLIEEDAAQIFRQIQLALRIQRKNEEFEAVKRRVAADPRSRELQGELQRHATELAKMKGQRL